jgi:hypothetical protein
MPKRAGILTLVGKVEATHIHPDETCEERRMQRPLRACLVMLVPLFLTITGCDPRPAPTPTPTKETTAPLRDPLDRNQTASDLKQPVHWIAHGQDQTGMVWDGYLIVEHAEDGYLQRGYFAWTSNPTGGQYHFKGTFDPETRKVSWTGYTVTDRTGNPCNAHYEATLSPDGRRLENGKWSGGISIPGKWTAKRVEE